MLTVVKAHLDRGDHNHSFGRLHLLLSSRLYVLATVLPGYGVVLTRGAVPVQASWLSEEEKVFVQGRLPSNAPRDAEKNFNGHEFLTTLKDFKLWLFLLCWAFFTIGTTGLTFYQPTVIANLGFT